VASLLSCFHLTLRRTENRQPQLMRKPFKQKRPARRRSSLKQSARLLRRSLPSRPRIYSRRASCALWRSKRRVLSKKPHKRCSNDTTNPIHSRRDELGDRAANALLVGLQPALREPAGFHASISVNRPAAEFCVGSSDRGHPQSRPRRARSGRRSTVRVASRCPAIQLADDASCMLQRV